MFGIKSIVLGSVISLAGLAAGCQSNGQQPAMASASDRALHCDKCKTTWVEKSDRDSKGRFRTYRVKGSTECPDCNATASNFFRTGMMQNTCKTCGDDMKMCEVRSN